MPLDPTMKCNGPPVQAAMLAAIPNLRAFAFSLCRYHERADDLVQETLLRACTNITQFQPGTNMPAWLITILRNCFYSDHRRRRREIEDVDGRHAKALIMEPDQSARIEYEEVRRAIADLSDEMREALILVGPSGYSYDEAARICGCAVGTIKSRVHRARTGLAAMLSVERSADFGAGSAPLSIGHIAKTADLN